MARSRTPHNGNITTGTPVPSSGCNHDPGGKFGADTSVANTTIATGTTQICAVTVTVAASREVDIEVGGTGQVATLADSFQVTVQEDGVTILRRNYTPRNANEDYNFYEKIHSTGPSAGAHTYRLLMGPNGSSGSVSSIASATNPTTLYVYDAGTSF